MWIWFVLVVASLLVIVLIIGCRGVDHLPKEVFGNILICTMESLSPIDQGVRLSHSRLCSNNEMFCSLWTRLIKN